jgi:pseudouridine synthase
MLERLQKILSARGISSRRKAEEYINAGLVKVNGKVAKLGDKADTSYDTVEVDGKVLADRATMLYYLMNKPVGVETVNIDRKDRISEHNADPARSVRDILPADLKGKVFPVGRLDKDSSGLLLFTNDGVLSYRLTHPSFNHEKEYEVQTGRPITPMVCRQIEEGFVLDGVKTKPLKCVKTAPDRARVVLTEGKNRQIRRMFQQAGYTVKSLKRIRIMTVTDDTLAIGSVRALTQAEKTGLLRSVGL